jgi:hypothetical protein
MDPAHTIARLLGPVLSVVGIGMLANGAVYRVMVRQFLAAYPFIYVSGILALLAGLAILNVHHRWTRDWRSLVTALGWLMAGVGTFRILAPQLVTYVGHSIGPDTGFFAGAGIILLALGGFITFKGYAA